MVNNIAIEYNPSAEYPVISPFSPSEKYPEYQFEHFPGNNNSVYDQVRNMLVHLKLDIENFNLPAWNPLGGFINPGNKIVIKPNWVREMNPVNQDISGLVTHPSIIRAIIDYCLIALKGKGQIIIGDAPIQSADYELLKTRLQVDELIGFYKGKTSIPITVEDFRKEIKMYGSSGEVRVHQVFEEKEFVEVNLQDKSYLSPVISDFRKFRVTNYNPAKMFGYHSPGKNIYVISRSVLDADVIIHVPKLKTHRKAGITCCLKNNVGINGSKDALVHHMKGSKPSGGDAYPSANPLKWLKETLYEMRERTTGKGTQRFLTFLIGLNDGLLKRIGSNPVFEGSWYGNETLWRMLLDINNILFYSDSKGVIRDMEQRKVFYVVDGIIGGEKDGPLKPDNKFAGLIIGGWNPVLIDMISAVLIGYDFRKITSIKKALENKFLGFGENDPEKSSMTSNGNDIKFSEIRAVTKFEPTSGWKNHIEA